MSTKIFTKVSDAADELFTQLGNEMCLAAPLGLGKPNVLLNVLYDRAKNNPQLKLTLYTALSLNLPHPPAGLGRKFLKPFSERHWGKNYPELEYAKDAQANKLPPNVKVHEFYFLAGSLLNSPTAQRDYLCVNYTHVCKPVFQKNVRVVVQLIARNPNSKSNTYSLSSNTDVSLDLIELYKKHKKPLLVVGVVHPDMPFLGGEAEVSEDFFDMIIDDPENKHELYATPRMPIVNVDHAIGFYASQMVADNGTLQIGIGSLADALVSSLILRHTKPEVYSHLVEACWQEHAPASELCLEKDPFEKGLYGLSEMVSDGYMHFHRAGILKRHVTDERSGANVYLHGAFFLGSKDFYAWLRSLKGDDFTGLQMTRVSRVNDLYDPHESTLRKQRINPRFINTCMQVSLLGGVASETLEDGRVVSGVGGQYNFVAMSHELENSRSILLLRSTREHKGERLSNIVWSLGNQTIPRHLRDVVITEYGIANLFGKTDEETICELLNIADSQFQEELMLAAKKQGKLAQNYEIPTWARNNTPEKINRFISMGKKQGTFATFALGSDFTPEEGKLVVALEKIKNLAANTTFSAKWKIASMAWRGMTCDPKPFQAELARMGLQKPRGLKEKWERQLVLAALYEEKEST